MNKKPEQDFKASLGTLIEQLGPLNNRWRQGNPVEKVLTLWDMGEIILKVISNPTDPLLWKIQEKSYITRSVLRYALVVRRGWENRNALEDLVRDLHNYTIFREALPFLKGNRGGIDDNTYRKVVSLLSNPNTRQARQYLKELKARRIGRRHKKGASIAAIRDEAVNFKRALTQLEAKAANVLTKELPAPSDVLVALSRLAMSLATGGEISLSPSVVKAKDYLPELAKPLLAAVKGGRTSATAFRKLIGAECLMEAADLLNSMQSEKTLTEWRHRHNARLSFSPHISLTK